MDLSTNGLTDFKTPQQLGFHFPAEWEKHTATWLSWPHKEASWPGKIDTIYKPYSQFIKNVSEGEFVCINVLDDATQSFATKHLQDNGVDLSKIKFYHHPTNDAWCRDHGPAFLVNRKTKEKAIVDWGYNAWGNKYPPYDLDDVIPTLNNHLENYIFQLLIKRFLNYPSTHHQKSKPHPFFFLKLLVNFLLEIYYQINI